MRFDGEADVITCPNCGTQNEPGSHFCQECGANLGTLASSAPPVSPPAKPTWVAGQGWVGSTSSAPYDSPPPMVQEPPASRTWLRTLLIAVAILIVLCCATSIFASTKQGTEWIDRASTSMAEHK